MCICITVLYRCISCFMMALWFFATTLYESVAPKRGFQVFPASSSYPCAIGIAKLCRCLAYLKLPTIVFTKTDVKAAFVPS